jgi:hypothetical protein
VHCKITSRSTRRSVVHITLTKEGARSRIAPPQPAPHLAHSPSPSSSLCLAHSSLLTVSSSLSLSLTVFLSLCVRGTGWWGASAHRVMEPDARAHPAHGACAAEEHVEHLERVDLLLAEPASASARATLAHPLLLRSERERGVRHKSYGWRGGVQTTLMINERPFPRHASGRAVSK